MSVKTLLNGFHHACTFRGIRLKEVARLPMPVNVPDGAFLACTVSVLCKGVKAENMLF